MKLSSPTALLALAATTSADVLRIPVARISPGAVTGRDPHPRLSKRASFTESLANNITGGGYYASVTVGTPGQNFDLVMDTGSSDAFLIAQYADLCGSRILQAFYETTCGQTFDPSLSSTYQVAVPGGFQIEYLDGSGASGDYIKDKFNIGGATINALQMGLANKTATGTGVLGIGFRANEATASEYPNLIDQMLNQSLIPTRAYSLYLNDYSSSTGNILFGGVDTQKFIGELVDVPILPDSQSQNYTSFTVGMTALSLSYSNGTTYHANISGNSLDAILDSGTTLSYLPDEVATPLFASVGAYAYGASYQSSAASELALVDCALAGSGLEVTLRFNGAAAVTVPADELVIDAFDQAEIPDEVPFEEACLFGIQNLGSSVEGGEEAQMSFALLGDTFLRSAYVVYDIDNRQVGLAQANLNSTKSDVQGLSADVASLPAYTGVAKQEEPSASGSISSTSGTVSSTSTAGSSTTAGGSSTTASGTGMLSMISSSIASSILTTSVGTTIDPSEVVSSLAATTTSTRAGPCMSRSPSLSLGVISNGTSMSSVDTILVPPSASAAFTNILIASSTANAAAPLRRTPGNGGVVGVFVALAFATCGVILFWL